MNNVIHSQLALPIEIPRRTLTQLPLSHHDYTFDSDHRFIDYSLHSSSENQFVSRDDKGQWYFFTSFECHSLDELKLTRQSLRPSYLKNESLPLMLRLEELQLTPSEIDFDKAYGHALYVLDRIKDLPSMTQLRLANYDGTDDPIIVRNLHYITNEYKGDKTRIVTGFETRSFATITENEYYAKEIHLPSNACNYLKLFIYFSKYGHIPSMQMMPRFLANLWASATSMNVQSNPALFDKKTME